MAYRICIERIETETYTRMEWLVVADTGNPRDGGRLWEYVPTEAQRETTTKVYEQRVQNLDLARVIVAINGIECRHE